MIKEPFYFHLNPRGDKPETAKYLFLNDYMVWTGFKEETELSSQHSRSLSHQELSGICLKDWGNSEAQKWEPFGIRFLLPGSPQLKWPVFWDLLALGTVE